MQDRATSHTSNVCQQRLRKLRGRRFIGKLEWPPKSPDCNPIDDYFWDALKVEVHRGRRDPFTNIDQLKRRIRKVWQRSITVSSTYANKGSLTYIPSAKKI